MHKFLLLLWLLLTVAVQAEVITDGSLGAQVSLSGSDYAITQDLGALQSTNLFHSFEQFSLVAGESVTFSGDASIQNIFSRVTGGQISNIDGLIRNTIPDADLYLMNPAGVVFGKDASLDLQGSFYVTTADLIQFSDDNVFYNIPQQNTILSTAAPTAYGFLDNEIGKIEILGAKLTLPVNQTLSLTGDDISVQGGTLAVASGNVYLTSVASSGEVYLQPEIEPTTLLGNMRMTGRSSITTSHSENSSLKLEKGNIFIRAGLFKITDSTINTSAISENSLGGDINIQAQDLTVQNSNIASRNSALSQGGNIIIDVENQALFNNVSDIAPSNVANRTTINTSNENIGLATGDVIPAGNSGNIHISATDINIADATVIDSTSLGTGEGGQISLVASNDIVISGQNAAGQTSRISSNSGNTAQSKANVGNGSNIFISAKNLTLNAGANITANANALGQGGNININLTEKLTLEQESNNGIGNFMSAATISKDENAGNGGNIVIQANELLFANGSFLTTNTAGAGNAGSIVVNVKQNATITGISTQTDSGILSAASSSSVGGNAGDISLTVGEQLFLDDLAIIDASTFNRGLGGNVNIIAGDITMRNQAYIGAASASSGNTGDINILINKDNLEMYDTSYITTEATFADGGNINVSMPNYVYISGDSEITTSIQSGVGGGGNIDLDAEFTVLEGGRILAQAYGGPGGNINIVTTSIYNLTERPIEQAISASSQLGVDGIITVRSPDADTDESVLILTGDFLQTDRLLRDLCNKKRNGDKNNSFVITGRESYPNLINDWLPSNATQLVLQRCKL